MRPPDTEVQAELERLLREHKGRLGDVFRLSKRGLNPDQIAAELGVPSSNFVSNNRTIARALLEGHMPNGPAMAKQASGGVRGLVKGADLSPASRNYVSRLLASLAVLEASHQEVAQPRSKVETAAPPIPAATRSSLRDQVEAAIRSLASELLERIRSETSLEPDDYFRLVSENAPLDALVRLVQVQATSRTTRALHQEGRLDLSLEAAVLAWAKDLPLSTDIVESARGRLDYWSST